MKKYINKILIITCFLILSAISLISCDTSGNVFKIDFFALDTYISVTAYDCDKSILAGLEELVRSYENKISVTNEDSQVSLFNRNKTATFDSDISSLLEKSLDACKKTQGYFDITVHPAVKKWGFFDDKLYVPTSSELKELTNKIDYKKITCNGEIYSTTSDCEIDLGGCAKGYIGDKCAEYLVEHNVTSAVINLGGNVKVLGKKTDNSKYNIAIESPDKYGYIAYISAEDTSIVTSGAYERNFADESGNIYHHIIDPFTAAPAQSDICSVSIICDDGTLADCLSTALYVMGSQKAIEFSNTHDNFGAIILMNDDTVFVSESIKNIVTLEDKYILYRES
ncbi:MAG: FAD:protein FMN transferase [Clostridia bacterium]|nr:FAD:protein FMN transferase [Clostridia bacterium]